MALADWIVNRMNFFVFLETFVNFLENCGLFGNHLFDGSL